MAKVTICPGCESGCALEKYQCGRGKFIFEEWQREGGEPQLKIPGGFKPHPAPARASMLMGILSHAFADVPDMPKDTGSLGILMGHGGLISPFQFGKRARGTAEEIERLIGSLEERGYIERVEEQGTELLKITQAGEQEAKRNGELRNAHIDSFFSQLTTDEQEELVELLEKLYDPIRPERLRFLREQR